jgi:hypothetical protein
MTTLMRRNGGDTRREGLPEFHRAVAEIDRVLDTAPGSLGGPTPGTIWQSAFTPLADIEETGRHGDLPGRHAHCASAEAGVRASERTQDRDPVGPPDGGTRAAVRRRGSTAPAASSVGGERRCWTRGRRRARARRAARRS